MSYSTKKPIAIIRYTEGHVLKDVVFQQLGETTISASEFSTTDFLKPADVHTMPAIEKAWRWYRAYLDSEDGYGKDN